MGDSIFDRKPHRRPLGNLLVAEEVYPSTRLEEGLSGPEPRAWCRVCLRQCEYSTVTLYSGGFFGFYARCHGETTGGLIHGSPYLMGFSRLEVFCFDDPHMDGYVWYVNADGSVLQDAHIVTEAIVERGGIFRGPVGEFFRNYSGIITALAMNALWIAWALNRRR